MGRSPHVALVTPWERSGGISTYSERYVNALRDWGIRVSPVPIDHTESRDPFAFVEVLDDVPDDAELIHVQFEAGLFGRLGVTGSGAPAFLIALGNDPRPSLVTLHEVHACHEHRGIVGDYLLRARDLVLERLALESSDRVVVHTAQAKRVLEARHGPGRRIEQQLHPAEGDATPRPTDEAKAELGLSGQVALTFGFVEEKKRYADVIRALTEIPSLTYLIAGGYRDGEGERVMNSCRTLARELGVEDRLEYVGYVEDKRVPVVYSAADVVVLPYDRVGQSGVINEALAYSRPVVTTALLPFEELRTEFECLLTYNHPSGLPSTLETVLFDTAVRERLGERSEEYSRQTTWSQFAEDASSIYNELTQ